MVTQRPLSSCSEFVNGRLCEVVLVPEEDFDYRRVLAYYARPVTQNGLVPVLYCKDVPVGADPAQVPWLEIGTAP